MHARIPRRRAPYIPAGCDQQGRVTPTLEQRPGLHLVDTSDHGAAHVCSGITSDSDDTASDEGAGAVLVPVCFGLGAVACWALFAFLTSPL